MVFELADAGRRRAIKSYKARGDFMPSNPVVSNKLFMKSLLGAFRRSRLDFIQTLFLHRRRQPRGRKTRAQIDGLYGAALFY